MCKHVLNAQVSIRAPCCRRWFDCPECHANATDHPLKKALEMVFACKKCKKVFRKDVSNYEEQDEFCPHCDNKYVLEAVTPQMEVGIETEDLRKDARVVRDPRMQQSVSSSLENLDEYLKLLEQDDVSY
ncbi:hypothetical protein HMI54_013033 [Coelomomyces lativittatus]|nr:hypothetical protein HMI56_001366 [Coelomomyces lativittatus]KAJ1515009.1 hypothetical protein HMI54_013033 [Coelomomyces lativittatus]KAJ1518447.1 hypothetical protein HMI55_000007 [Coelomomyces lativittatus]